MAESADEADEHISTEAYIIAVDVGTTTVRSHVYNHFGVIKGTGSRRIEILHPAPGRSEMDPHLLYKQFVDCVTDSIRAAGIKVNDVTCLGITTQRNTMLTWDRESGEPFHNFITWQDLRARDYVKDWNDSYSLKVLNSGSRFLHAFTRKKRFLAASVLKFMSAQVTLRLLWLLDNVEQLRLKATQGLVMFGCIESWLLYKLTGGKVHATDYSCASATGLFDPFQVEWSTIVCGLVNIPMTIFPEVKATSGLFGNTDSAVFGTEIPITCLAEDKPVSLFYRFHNYIMTCTGCPESKVGDQSASMFGQCSFEAGDINCTMGTGTFIDVNTGSTPHASVAGLYPLIGWKIGGQLTYIAEGQAADTGNTLEWAKSLGLFDDVADTADIAESVPDSGGVYFVAAYSGLQAPINDDKAVTSLIGMQPGTTKAHIVRAMLESIAFRFKLLYETVLVETKLPLSHVRVDGGVCTNDFLVQLMADLTNQVVDRAKQTENMTSLGTAFLAGLASGVWRNLDEVKKLRTTDQLFEPQPTWSKYKAVFHEWERAVNRSRKWYQTT